MKTHFPRKGTIVYTGPGQVISTGKGFRVNWRGTEGNDSLVAGIKSLPHAIYGLGGNDYIVGGNKQNSLFGGNGDDVLKGGDDVDMLLGHQGNDKLDGGKGSNHLWGNEGKDTFVINSTPGSHSEIKDFKQGEDTISIKGERGKDWDFGTNEKGEVIIERIDGGSKAQVVATINGVKPDGISDSDILQSGTSEKDIYSSEADAESAVNTEAVGGRDPIPPFPYWDAVEPGFGETDESVLKESGMDGLRESDPQTAAADSLTGEPYESTGNFTRTVREFLGQPDSVTGDGLANADTDGSPSWFHMHHDDGINDGYLDVGADASGFDSFLLQSGSDLITPIAEPFADAAAITDLVTGQSSPMEAAIDPLVAAGPLDAVKVDEPRNNDF